METVHDVREGQTLGALLSSVAHTRLPAQFYQLLQLAIPFAFQFWSYGLHRTAGWMIVVSLFGLWALCVQRLEDSDPADTRFAWIRIGRTVTATVAALMAGGLALEAFVRFMTMVFRCPGCAG